MPQDAAPHSARLPSALRAAQHPRTTSLVPSLPSGFDRPAIAAPAQPGPTLWQRSGADAARPSSSPDPGSSAAAPQPPVPATAAAEEPPQPGVDWQQAAAHAQVELQRAAAPQHQPEQAAQGSGQAPAAGQAVAASGLQESTERLLEQIEHALQGNSWPGQPEAFPLASARANTPVSGRC